VLLGGLQRVDGMKVLLKKWHKHSLMVDLGIDARRDHVDDDDSGKACIVDNFPR